ncbi:hypothetical protein D3C87_1820520 [compost metagenome]
MLRDFLAQAMGGFIEPGRAELRGMCLLAPTRLLLVEKFGELDRLAKVDRDLAEALLEGADNLEYV